jgi:hypothetical protein
MLSFMTIRSAILVLVCAYERTAEQAIVIGASQGREHS